HHIRGDVVFITIRYRHQLSEGYSVGHKIHRIPHLGCIRRKRLDGADDVRIGEARECQEFGLGDHVLKVTHLVGYPAMLVHVTLTALCHEVGLLQRDRPTALELDFHRYRPSSSMYWSTPGVTMFLYLSSPIL